MTDSAMEALLGVIGQSDTTFLAGPQPEEAIAAAETALGVRFPRDYRAFVRAWGLGPVGSNEVFGVDDSDAWPHIVGINNDLRAHGLSPEALVFFHDGGDTYYYFYLPEGEDPKVRGWFPGVKVPFSDGEIIVDSFATILAEFIDS